MFELETTTAILDFRGTDLDGLEVRCSLDMSLGDLFDFQGAVAGLPDDASTADAGDRVARGREAFKRWGDEVLISWNLRWRGADVPATGAGMLAIPARVATAILRAYSKAANGELPTNSADGSTSGAPSAAASGATAP